MTTLGLADFSNDLVGLFHGHSTKIGDEVDAVDVTCQTTLVTFSRLLSAQSQHVTTVATPVGAHVGKWLESVGNPVVDLLLVRVRFGIRFTDALGDNV